MDKPPRPGLIRAYIDDIIGAIALSLFAYWLIFGV